MVYGILNCTCSVAARLFSVECWSASGPIRFERLSAIRDFSDPSWTVSSERRPDAGFSAGIDAER